MKTFKSQTELVRHFRDLAKRTGTALRAVGLPAISSIEPQRDFTTTLWNVVRTLADARQTRRAIFLVSPRGCVPDPPSSFGAFECRDAVGHGQQRSDIFIGKQQGHGAHDARGRRRSRRRARHRPTVSLAPCAL